MVVEKTRELLEQRVQQVRDRKEFMEPFEDHLLKSQRQISELDSRVKLVEAQHPDACDQHLRTMNSYDTSLIAEKSETSIT
mmetsp:Transcript_11179/g.20184  ORF Transcript_11179/g.20184 Transcript_11179/m.20184 type:complete len:81 (+) Transcript_11179:330-572(+)